MASEKERAAQARIDAAHRAYVTTHGVRDRDEIAREYAAAFQALLSAATAGSAPSGRASYEASRDSLPSPPLPIATRTTMTPMGQVTVYYNPQTGTIVAVSGPGSGMFPGVPVVTPPGTTTAPPPPPPPAPSNAPAGTSGGSGSTPSSPPGDYPEPPDPDQPGGTAVADTDGDIAVGGRTPRSIGSAPKSVTRDPRNPGYVDPADAPSTTTRGTTPRTLGTVVVDPASDPARPSSVDGVAVPRTAADAAEQRLGGVIDPADAPTVTGAESQTSSDPRKP